MAAKKITSKTRKVTRAKATKKTSVRSGRKAPGGLIKAPVTGAPTPVDWQ